MADFIVENNDFVVEEDDFIVEEVTPELDNVNTDNMAQQADIGNKLFSESNTIKQEPEFVVEQDFEVEEESFFSKVKKFDDKLGEGVKTYARESFETAKDIARVYPVLEAGASLLTSAVSLPASGITGMIAGAATGDIDTAGKVQEKTANLLTAVPQTHRGEKFLETTMKPFEVIEKAGQAGGDYALEKTDNPTLATAMHTGIVMLPALVHPMLKKGKSLKSAKKVKKANKQVLDNAETEFLKSEFKETFLKDEPTPIKTEKKPKVIKEEELNWTPEHAFPNADKATLYSGLPIPEIFKGYKKATDVIWDVGVEQKLPKLIEKIPGGKAINKALIYDYRGDLPNTGQFIRSMESKNRAQQIGRSYALDLGNRLAKIPEKDQLAVGEFLRGEKKTLPSNMKGLGDEAKLSLLDLGKQAVDVGILSEETFFKNAGRYMPRLYTSKEYSGLLQKFNTPNPGKLDLSRFKKRQDIPKEIRQEMGEILTPGYPVAKGITQLTHDIEQARWFSHIAKNEEWAIPKTSKTKIPDGWQELPTDKKLGTLSGARVNPEIYTDITQSIKVSSTPEKVWKKALGAWKFGKVVASPKTHARNLMSNSVLAHLGGLPMYEQPIYLSRAMKEMRGKGKHWKQATREGLLDSTWTENELSSLFSGVESQLKGIKVNSLPEKLGVVGKTIDKGKQGMNKMAKAYQAEEEWFKLSKYIHNIEKRKMTPKQAAMDAEKWLFNYAKVTKAQDAYRTKWYGAPFATFTIKALPRIAEAAVKTPHRFVLPGAMIYGLEKAASNLIGDSKEQQKAKKELRPDWMQGDFLGMPNFARVPIIDESGREYYLNLTYILPWGDIGEGGDFGGIPGSLMPMSQPFLKESWQQIANYDSFWKQPIVAEDDVAGKDMFDQVKTQVTKRGGHLAQTLAPTPILDAVKAVQAFNGKPDGRGRMRPSSVVAADTFLGIKLYPVDYVEQMVRRINKINPSDGSIARKLKGQIKTLEIKRRAVEKRGGNGEPFKKQIETKIKQINGLAKKAQSLGKTYKKLNKEN